MSSVNSDSFMIPLTQSMGMVLDEFYNTFVYSFSLSSPITYSFIDSLTHSLFTITNSFIDSLTHSSTIIDRMHTVGVSAVTGEGVNDLMDAIAAAKEEYFSVFLDAIKVFTLLLNTQHCLNYRRSARKRKRTRRDAMNKNYKKFQQI